MNQLPKGGMQALSGMRCLNGLQGEMKIDEIRGMLFMQLMPLARARCSPSKGILTADPSP